MQFLEGKILKDGKVLAGDVLKVDGFLNHRIDVSFVDVLAFEFARHFREKGVTEVLTVESSGISLAVLVARYLNCPVLVAKKAKTKNLVGDVYTAEVYSFTHAVNTTIFVCSEYISDKDNVLIIDDFAANGEAMRGLMSIINQANASLVGIGIAIEKGYQHGADKLREEGIDVFSLAIIDEMGADGIKFREQ